MLTDFENESIYKSFYGTTIFMPKLRIKFDIEFGRWIQHLTDYTYTAPMYNYIVKSNTKSIDNLFRCYFGRSVRYIKSKWECMDEILHIVKSN